MTKILQEVQERMKKQEQQGIENESRFKEEHEQKRKTMEDAVAARIQQIDRENSELKE